MKKVLKLIILIIAMASGEASAKTWWQYASIDAGGALGGAIGAAQSGIGFLTGGWGIAGGAVVMGAAASCGAAPIMNGGDSPNVNPFNPALKSNNYDLVGKHHNDLLNSYLEAGTVNSDLHMYDLYSKLGLTKQYGKIPSPFMEKIDLMMKKGNTIKDPYDFIKSNLPKSVNADKFIDDISVLSKAGSAKEYVTEAKAVEEKFFKSSKLKEKDLVTMKVFFSTLRYSGLNWFMRLNKEK